MRAPMSSASTAPISQLFIGVSEHASLALCLCPAKNAAEKRAKSGRLSTTRLRLCIASAAVTYKALRLLDHPLKTRHSGHKSLHAFSHAANLPRLAIHQKPIAVC